MRHSLVKLVFILILAKIDQLDSRAVKVIYTGQGCECHKKLPYHVNIPVQPEPTDPECRSYGYKIEGPPPTRAKYSYSFDFIVEEPVTEAPQPTCKENLFATIDRIALPKPDCVMEESAPCGMPVPEQHPPKPAPKPCQYNKNKICTCGTCKSGNPPVDYDYEVDVPVMSRSCSCGQCHPSNPQCRYVLSGIPPKSIAQLGGRSKRDVSTQKKPNYIEGLRNYIKSLKAARDARKTKNSKKSKIVKRDIKGEYDLLQKDQADLDLTIPEIIQYMPETLMPNFKRGKCNIGCKNCINRHPNEQQENNSPPETANNDNNDNNQRQWQQMEKPAERGFNENTYTTSSQHYRTRPRFYGANSLKRSVNSYQYPQQPCQAEVLPPPYTPNPLHLATLAENPGNPIWYEPRPLIDPNGRYVFDRLGHKYEVKNGSLKLLTPQNVDDVYVSTPVAPVVGNTGEYVQSADGVQTQGEPIFGYQQMQQSPIVGAPAHHGPSYDPQMDKVIRDIIYRHPDFVDASQHAPGSVTLSQDVQSDETIEFLKKLIRGRLNNWFGTSEAEPSSHFRDLDRYSRETGTSVKFIPVVTIDKEKLNKYRKRRAKIVS